jgi:hypothetical protein
MDFITHNFGLLYAAIPVISLCIACWMVQRNFKSGRYLARATKNTDEITSRLGDLGKTVEYINRSISTRYIDLFPNYMPEVTALISRAKRNISIMYVLPTPSIFSNYGYWFDYKRAIENALRPNSTITVNVVFSNPEVQDEFLHAQFDNERTIWAETRSKDKFKENLRVFIERCGKRGMHDYDVDNISYDQFHELFRYSTEIAERDVFRGAKKYEIDFRPQVFSWVIDDGKEAIFAIPILRPIFTAYAFLTSDPEVTKAIVSLHQEHFRSAPPPKQGGAQGAVPAHAAAP